MTSWPLLAIPICYRERLVERMAMILKRKLARGKNYKNEAQPPLSARFKLHHRHESKSSITVTPRALAILTIESSVGLPLPRSILLMSG